MKKTIYYLSFLAILALSSCDSVITCEEPIGVMVRIQNISDIDVDNVTLNDVEFGTIKGGATTDYMDVVQLTVIDDYIASSFSAKIEGIDRSTGNCLFCGTGMEDLPEGLYTVELDVQGDKAEGETWVTITLKRD